jgi:predicted regulator of Ras-like GTPase activity (Roadblock/LC7/MglB family)
MNSSKKDLIDRISILIDEQIKENSIIKGISVGTNMGTNLYTKLDSDLQEFSGNQLIASATSFQNISSSLLGQLTKNEISSNFVTVEKYILIMNIVKDVSGAAILDRKFAELEGIEKIQKDFKILMQKIATHIETSDFFFEDPFVKISQALPTALSLILASIEGMPIKAIGLKNMSEPMISSMVSSISNLTQVMMRADLDYCIIEGNEAFIIIIQYDPKRILAVCLPEQEKAEIGHHLATIKSIIEKSTII